MYRKILFVLLAWLAAACAAAWGFDEAQLRGLTENELMKRVRIHSCTEAELDALLPDLHRRYPAFDDRVKALARLYKGGPYVDDPLTNEAADWLPYRATNCTMFVLYIEALANSRSLSRAREHMRLLHYRGGRVGYASRYHFTEDRITDPANRYFAEATEAYVKDRRSLSTVTLELNRKRDGTLLLGDRLGPWTKRILLAYVRRSGFSPGLLQPLPRVLGIAFVKKQNWDKGLIVGHEGLLIDGDLYHSSPGAGVVMVKDYLTRGFPASPWEGFILFRLASVRDDGRGGRP